MRNAILYIHVLCFLHLKEKSRLRVQETEMSVHVQATKVLLELILA